MERPAHQRPRLDSDPRPDLANDSAAWTALLGLAWRNDQACGAVLHYMRCGGLRLKRVAGTLRFDPMYAPRAFDADADDFAITDSYWERPEEWAADRALLVPFRDRVKQLLGWMEQYHADTLQFLPIN